MEGIIEESEEMKSIDDAEIDNDMENVFPINESLELVYNHGAFHIMSEEGYVVFKDVCDIQKKDENSFFIMQQGDTAIVMSKEEYDMICKAVEMCEKEK